MRRAALLFLILPWILQHSSHAAAPLSQPAAVAVTPPNSPAAVNLGESSVELDGPWKFHPGDNHRLVPARLRRLHLGHHGPHPAPGSADETLAISGDLPGWTDLGYPNYSGYAWYRLRVNVQGATRRLALKMPDQADDAYQVFVNGQQIGSFGKFTAHHVTAYSTLPEDFRLPKNVGNGTITIAIRMWMDSATPFSSPDAGGLHGPPVLGYASVIGALTQLDYYENARDFVSSYIEWLILFMAMIMALALFWLDREEKAYLWLALVCLATLL